ncbi:hypothetical protein BGX33_010501 [Mortierella sp. NVP41]|nr:hypothetical protein BGX33_010501 [Mortierella sp. NVP41]
MGNQGTRRVDDNNAVAPNQEDHDQHQEEEEEHSDPARALAERVYSWSIAELDYRPDRGDIRSRSHPRIGLYASSSRAEQPEYCPQALTSLCHGPCGPMFEYLAENLKSRSKDARREREIAETKERIKKQRQLQTAKEIHHRQDIQTIRVLQEYQGRLQQTQITPLAHGTGTNQHMLEATLQKTLQEISALLKQVALVQPHATRGALESRSRSMQGLYEKLQQTSDGVTHLLDLVAGSKRAQLLALEAIKDQKLAETSTDSDTAASNGAASLLHMFRGHHIERVVQIESVLNKVAACEREKTQLYTEMRFRAQRRDQEKKPNYFLQELEETKAYLKGLGTALEFIQVEQENLVERVMGADELRSKLDALGKASRATEQKLRQAQYNVRKVMGMVELNLQGVPSLANSIAGDITESLSQGLAQLSTSVQTRNTTGVNDIKILQDLTNQSQLVYEANHAHLLPLPGPALPGALLFDGSGTDASNAWYESAGGSSLSADQLILQKARLQSHNLVRQLAVLRAKELNNRLARSNDETISMMKASSSQIPGRVLSATTSQGINVHMELDTGGALNVDSLASKFEGGIKEIVGSLVRYDHNYQRALATEMEQVIEGTESAAVVVEGVRSLVDDGGKITTRLEASYQELGRPKISRDSADRKRMRYIH